MRAFAKRESEIGAVISSIILCGVLVAFAYRITVGVNLSDESYYTTIIDGWLKDGLCCSSNLVLHQTAELVVLPFARVYTLMTGGEYGLVLFLRAIFMIASCISGLCWYMFVKRIRDKGVAFCSAAFIICFVPFSLPAPSYNTIGMLAMLCGLALFGMAVLQEEADGDETSTRTTTWIMVLLSGFAWLIAVIAYPTLAPVQLIVFCSAAILMRGYKLRLLMVRYGIVSAVWLGLGLGFLFVMYGWARLLAIFRFTNAAMHVSDGLAVKLYTGAALLSAHPGFLALCVASTATGFLSRSLLERDRDFGVLASAVLAGIVLTTCFVGPVLFFRGHDIVLLLALSGLGGISLRGQREPAPQVIRIIYCGGLLAGLITAATATNGLYNFAIGGLPAAVLAPVLLVSSTAPPLARLAHRAMMMATALATGAQAFLYIYGEPANPLRGPAVRIQNGVFAGLLTAPNQALFITEATRLLTRVALPGRTMLVVGRLPGIYLLTSMSPDALSTWDFSQFYGSVPPQVDAWVRAFYHAPEHAPDVIVVIADPWTRPTPPWAEQLLAQYVETYRIKIESQSVILYEPSTARARSHTATAMPVHGQ
jgi:hypothetical protein